MQLSDQYITDCLQGDVYRGEPVRRKIGKTSRLEDVQPYRLVLWRRFRAGAPLESMVSFIGLNPSTAVAAKLDSTVAKCEGYAKSWGFDGFVMLNIFPYRATDAAEMKMHKHHTGYDSENARVLLDVCRRTKLTVCCWGNGGAHHFRGKVIKALLKEHSISAKALHINNTGYPKHPLYHRNNTLLSDLVPFVEPFIRGRFINQTLKSNDFKNKSGHKDLLVSRSSTRVGM